MRAQLVAHPEHVDADPNALPWARRLKYTTVQELLDDYRTGNAQRGVKDCPVCDYFEAHLHEDVTEVTGYVYAHPDWGPLVLTLSMWRTLDFNNSLTHPHGEFIARWIQHYMALTLVALHPFERARHAVQDMLYEPAMRFVSLEAAYVILAYVNAGHPNPGRFLAKPQIRAKFPADLELERFPQPDFAPAAA